MYRLSRFSNLPEPSTSALLQEEDSDKKAIVRSVASALAENRIAVAFQPVVNSQNTKLQAFHECLVRIKEPNGTITPAAKFMPAIEDSDLGRMIDRTVLRQVVEVLKNNHCVRLSINLSANGIGDQEWLKILKAACQEAPQCGDFLIVEITESAMLTLDEEKFRFLNELRELGCSLALDDFGAGHTSIGQLTKLRFDFLKIDGSFTKNLANSEDNQFLLRSMVSIAEHFEMVSVAEMVDSPEAVEFLSEIGIDCLQGYLFGKPETEPNWLGDNGSQIAWSL